MFRRFAFILALLASVSLAEVRIRPPGPYMSSPPPPVDTTPLDPNRKPHVEIVAQGITEQWYADWDLVNDKSPSGPIQVTSPKKGEVTFYARFDNRGWVTELTHYDVRKKERWTKLFSYPPRIPAGPGDVPVTVTWYRADGTLIDLKELEAKMGESFDEGTGKMKIYDAIGEPMVMLPEPGKMETWIYATDKSERRFKFDKKGRLVQSSSGGSSAPAAAPAPAAAEPVAPAPAAEPAAPAPAAEPATTAPAEGDAPAL